MVESRPQEPEGVARCFSHVPIRMEEEGPDGFPALVELSPVAVAPLLGLLVATEESDAERVLFREIDEGADGSDSIAKVGSVPRSSLGLTFPPSTKPLGQNGPDDNSDKPDEGSFHAHDRSESGVAAVRLRRVLTEATRGRGGGYLQTPARGTGRGRR